MRRFLACFIILFFLFSGAAPAVPADDPDLISLDLKGMDIRDVLKILAQKSGLNIVADSDVKGVVTLYLKDVSPMDALNIVVTINNLGYVESGALIRVMSDRTYERLHGKKFGNITRTEVVQLKYANSSDVARVLEGIRTEIGKVIPEDVSKTIVLIDVPDNIKKMKELVLGMDVPFVTEVFDLDYAKADALKEKIGGILSKDLGSVSFDERTNKLIVKDTAAKMAEVKQLVSEFDEKTRDVVIDASIVQVALADKDSFGIDWSQIAKMGDVVINAEASLNTGLAAPGPNKLSIATTGGNYSSVFNFLSAYGKTEILSRPRITVMDGHEAKILVGSKEVYVSSDVTTTTGGTYHTSDRVQFVDVGVRLSVTPIINKAGFITLKIKPEVSNSDAARTVILKNPDGSTRTIVPYVTTSEAETSVVVKDNTTIIIGGLMKNSRSSHREKVPGLGDVPVAGRMFSSSGKNTEKTELVIFLTAHIIEGDKTLEEVAKYMDAWEGPRPPAPEIKTEAKAAKTEKKPKAKAEKKPKQKSKWTQLFGGRKEAPKRPAASRSTEIKTDPAAAEKTPYERYYLALRKDINDAASREDVGGLRGEVELQFTLDKEGFLIKGPIVLNRPDLKLVRNAVSCVKKASPFSRFPKGLKKEEAEFNVVVRYE